MGYVEFAKLGIIGLSLLIDLIREVRGGGGSDVVVDRGMDSLSKIGAIAKIKELDSGALVELRPLIKEFVSKLEELRKLNDTK